MTRAVADAFVLARGTDSVQPIDLARARALKAWGLDFAIRYLGSVTSDEIDAILAAGLAFMPVTFGMKHGTPLTAALGSSYGATTVRQAQAAGIPKGATIWLDLEDCTGTDAEVEAFVNAWCDPTGAAGYICGLYVGAGAILSSAQLYALHVTRYWQSLSKEVDQRGQLAEPACGWCMIQLYPSVHVAGLFADGDVIQRDYRGRVPSWVVGQTFDASHTTTP